jgi:FkbM family methyltransferase
MLSDKTIIQIGSNIGDLPNDMFFNHIDKSTKLYLVEPHYDLFLKLKENYKKKLHDTSNIIFINKAVSNFSGQIELNIPSNKNDFSKYPKWVYQLASINPEHINQHISDIIVDKIIVETTTLNQIVKEFNISHIDILQIDTEGHDYDILMSYDFHVKPKQIIFEFAHMDGVHKRGIKYNELINKLYSLGYTITNQFEMDTYLELI